MLEKAKLVCNLKDICEEKGVSINQLSKDVNHRRQTLNDLANNVNMGTARIPASLIAKLCVYLDVTLNDLFTVIRGDGDT